MMVVALLEALTPSRYFLGRAIGRVETFASLKSSRSLLKNNFQISNLLQIKTVC